MKYEFQHFPWPPSGDQVRITAAKHKRERRAERNLRNEARQGRGPEDLDLMKDGTWTSICTACGKRYTLCYAAVEFNPDINVCGGSQWCIP